MSSEIEEQVLLPDSRKSSKKSYTRDFLLSLSELDVCKKLPDGFDASILSEFGDAGSTGFDRQRSLGSLSLQGSKRGEYGPVSQNRLETSGSYTRGGQGRWDTRSSGSSDKDADVQSDRESVGQDCGRRFGNQTRRYWQNSEHDGLLGSGAFPRPTGYAGSAAPKARGNGPYQLNRSNEPFQPPRPYKAMPYSRKDSTDSYNDETFGSTECSSEDRAEEERKRRASFELMRKEQQKSLQEKHKPNLDNHKENLDADIIALLGNSADENSMNKNKSDEPAVSALSQSDSSRSSLHAQAPASRPLVPPGFRSSLVDKNLSVQSSSTSLESEAEVESKHSLIVKDTDNQRKGNIPVAFMSVNSVKNALKVSSQLSIDAIEMAMAPMLSDEVLKPTVDFEKISGKTAAQETNEVWEDDIVIMNDSSCKKGPASEMVNTIGQDNSTTILEKLFSSALSKTYTSSLGTLEHHGVQDNEEKWSPAVFESSKFAPWFSEEKKSEENFSSRELLSLIVSNEKSGSQVLTSTNAKASQHSPLNLTFESVGTPPKIPTSPTISSVIGVPEQYSQGDKKGQSSAVLTCEDLEQSILAEVKENSSSVHHVVRGGQTPVDGKSEKQKADIDDHASQHLLSLLQKGTNLKESISSPSPDIINSTDRYSGSHVHHSFDHISDNAAFRNPEVVHSSEQTLTLETLFGVSFMNALHSAEAPVSVQRASTGTGHSTDVQPHGVPFPSADEAFFSAISHESRSNKSIHEGDILALNNTQKNHNIPGPWVNSYSDSPIEASKLVDMGIEDGGASEIQPFSLSRKNIQPPRPMEATASGALLRRVPFARRLAAGDGGMLTPTRNRPVMVRVGNKFEDQGHLRYYAAAATPARCGPKREEKRRMKLVKGLERDLSALYSMGFDAAEGQDKGQQISEAAELLLAQLTKLRAETKEMKQRRKQEKAAMKAAKMKDRAAAESPSESSDSEKEMKQRIKQEKAAMKASKMKDRAAAESSSESSDSECEAVVKMSRSSLRTVSAAVSDPVAAAALQTEDVIEEAKSNLALNLERQCCSSGAEVALMPTEGKIEVCMGGKCKKSGAMELMAEFEKVVGAEGVVVGCKCMGKCRDGPNVRVVNQSAAAEEALMMKIVKGPLCIGVGLEDVGPIVAKFLGEGKGVVGLQPA